jgi:hypothetical protein
VAEQKANAALGWRNQAPPLKAWAAGGGLLHTTGNCGTFKQQQTHSATSQPSLERPGAAFAREQQQHQQWQEQQERSDLITLVRNGHGMEASSWNDSELAQRPLEDSSIGLVATILVTCCTLAYCVGLKVPLLLKQPLHRWPSFIAAIVGYGYIPFVLSFEMYMLMGVFLVLHELAFRAAAACYKLVMFTSTVVNNVVAAYRGILVLSNFTSTVVCSFLAACCMVVFTCIVVRTGAQHTPSACWPF